MTLLCSVFGAVIVTAIWYKNAPKSSEMLLSVPMFMLWGASIMWLVDAVFEYVELGAEYFTPSLKDMINDLFLGLSVVALCLVVWVVVLLIKDPKGAVKNALFKNKK